MFVFLVIKHLELDPDPAYRSEFSDLQVNQAKTSLQFMTADEIPETIIPW